MQPRELIERLAASGTGQAKLDIVRNLFMPLPNVTREIVDEKLKGNRHIPAGTLKKVYQILDGTFSETAGSVPGASELLERLRAETGEMLDTFEEKLDGALANIEQKTADAVANAKAEMQKHVVQAIADTRAELQRQNAEVLADLSKQNAAALAKLKAELTAAAKAPSDDKPTGGK